jgi:uncharacterized protein YkwD
MELHRKSFVRARAGMALAAGLLLVAACAGGGGAARPGPASVAGGKFTAAGGAAPNYGGPAPRACPSTAIARYVATDSADHARDAQKPPPQADGRLCAVAETLLGWDEQQPVPESVRSFLAFHSGLPSTIPAVVVATIESEDPKQLAARLEEVLTKYVATTAGPVHYGLATGPGSRGGIKVALAMQDPPVELDAFPRKLDPGADATLSGRLLGTAQNAKVLVSDPRGKLEQPESKPGKQFSAKLGCGGKTGRMAVEIRAEEQGQPRVVTNFPVYCGIDPPTSVQLPSAPGDAAQQERAVFEQINAERTEAQLPPLKWDDKIARVARSLAEADSKGGSGTAKEDIAAKLKEAGIASPSVLVNPAAARTAEDAQRLFSLSPVLRANYMTTEATTAGIGVANATAAQGGTVTYVAELFVRELAQVDVGTAAPKLREAINKRRTGSRMAAFADDPVLDKAAQQYAQALASGNGKIGDAKRLEIVGPVYRLFRTADELYGAKADPLEFADENAVVTSKEKAMGIGLAQGSHPVLGKNATYVVLLFGTRK